MRRRIASIVVLMVVVGAFFYAASGRMPIYYQRTSVAVADPAPQSQSRSRGTERGVVDMIADDSYLIDQGDSTMFILVGNFAAHHNGAVILADSAVRYSNQSFECFGNVLINQNSTYAYGERAEYHHASGKATIFSKIVKIVDGEATMYTYNCTFDTVDEVGEFYGGCYVEKGDNLVESERGYYNTKTHDLIAVDDVEMRDDKYLITGDSVVFNTQSEDARYFANTNIWNDKDEYLYADEGEYTKLSDLHHLKRNAYILTPEREIWGDTLKYYRTDEHIIGRRNLQVDDTTQKVLGFADYGEWWDDPGNAFFTGRPSLINYDPEQPDSLFLAADTLWLYTISAAPPIEPADSVGVERDSLATGSREALVEGGVRDTAAFKRDSLAAADRRAQREAKDGELPSREGAERPDSVERSVNSADSSASTRTAAERDSLVGADSLTVDSLAQDSVVQLTAKQLRYRAKLQRKAERDSLKAERRAVQDSIKAIKDAERDSIRKIRDSLLDIKLDTIIARRQARSARMADEEKARIERVKQKAEERRRHKIDKAKARALRRGKPYTGEDYTLDTLAQDSIADTLERADIADTLARDSLADSLAVDSMAMDSLQSEPPIPADSVYKMIKAYRNVRMYRSDSQMIGDSVVALNTDSVIRIYIDPVLWNEKNQITSDSMAIYTANRAITKAHFMGDPMLGSEIDTMYYNQVKGKDMVALFRDGQVCRHDVDGNAQTIYYMQDEEDSTQVTSMMYIESSGITFYLDEGQMDKITYRQNPDYVLYPVSMIPETQELRLPDFKWCDTLRPTRESIIDRAIRPSQRSRVALRRKPTFPITERINYDRRRYVENRMWVDRLDLLTPEVEEWRNSRPSYQNRKK